MSFNPEINKEAQEVIISGKLQQSNLRSERLNGTTVTQCEIQKRLELLLYSKLEFKEHFINVFN